MVLGSLILHFKAGPKKVLIFNGFSGLVDIISDNLWQKINVASKNNSWDKISQSSIELLKKRKYLFQNREQEKKLIDKLNQKLKCEITEKKKLAITINFSEDCNLACSYCFNKKRRQRKQMNIGQLREAISFIKEQIKKGFKIDEITLFGGEPLRLKSRPLFKYLLSTSPIERKRVSYVVMMNRGTTP